MPKRRAPPKKPKDQHDKFVEAARELGADMTEKEFKEALGRIAKPKPKGTTKEG